MRRILAPGLALAILAAPGAAFGQDTGSLAVLGGLSEFDLDGVGTTAVLSFRGTTSLANPLVVEGAVAYFPYSSQGSEQVNNVLPEAQLQLQWLRTGVRPYIGLGVGGAMTWISDAAEATTTLSTAAGVRWPVGESWGVQGELRIRAIDPWVGTTADWALGLTGRF